MTGTRPASSAPRVPSEPILAIAVTVCTILLLGTCVPAGEPFRGGDALRTLLTQSWPAALWLLAAWGLGDRLLTWIDPAAAATRGGRTTVLVLGLAGMLILDTALASTGLLGRDREFVAWTTVIVPAALGLPALGRRLAGLRTSTSEPSPAAGQRAWSNPLRTTLLVACGLPIGVLLLAATSAPGWLWATEFGGYDVLSYHLQLPREWWYASGLIETPHNAYGYLPGGVSAAFLHLMTLVGDPARAAIPSQLLVAGVTMVAAGATADLAGTIDRSLGRGATGWSGPLGGLALLATPWIVVVGSLAYDEAFVVAIAATTAALILRTAVDPPNRRREVARGALLGLLLGGAMLAKASSGVLVVVPMAALAALTVPVSRWLPIVLATALVGFLACLPWLARNWTWTGNPFFPLLSGLFGRGPWTAEQAARFARGHEAESIGSNLGGLLHEFLLDDLLPAPPSGDPTRPQWWWLPGAGLLALVVMTLRTTSRGGRARSVARGLLGCALVTMLAWVFLTHGKARFLVPLAPLLAAVVGVMLAGLADRRFARLPLGLLAGAVAIGPAVMYATERNGNAAWLVDGADRFDGRLEVALLADADPGQALDIRRGAGRPFILSELPPDSRTLLVGVADPLHLPIENAEGEPRRFDYTTVWTRGPLERIWDGLESSAPEDAARTAIEGLREAGYSHVLVGPTMLEVWSRSGWLDPTLQPERVIALPGVPGVRTVHVFPDGGTLLEI